MGHRTRLGGAAALTVVVTAILLSRGGSASEETVAADLPRASPSRGPEVTVRHLANEGVLLDLPEGTVLIDGLFGDGLPEYPTVPPATRDSLERALGPYRAIDLLLVTHVHRDHFDARAVERHLLANPGAELVGSRQVADSLRILGTRFEEIRDRVRAVDATPGRTTALEVAGIHVRVLGITHPPSRNQPVEHLAYVVGTEFPVAHVGDMGLQSEGIETLETAGSVSLLLAPYWILLQPGAARKVVEPLGPRCVAGFHVAREDADTARRQLEEGMPGAIALDRQALSLPDCEGAQGP